MTRALQTNRSTNALVTLLAAWLVLVCASAEGRSGELIVTNVTVISPEREAPLDKASVHIRDGRIVEVAGGELSVADEPRMLDGSGLFLVPGLMDSHVHTTFVPTLGFMGLELARSHPDLVAAYERQLPLSLLYFGVTQVLDPAPAPAGLARLRSAETRPDVLHCGAAPIIGGYPVNLLGAGIPPDAFPYLDTFPYVIDEPGTGRTLPVELLPAEHTPEAVVRRMREDGAVCVKLFFEDGWDLRSDWPLLKQDTARRVVREAHRSGMKVLAHANALDMQKLALAAGVDIIAHGLWNWNEHRKEEGLPAGIRVHLDEIRTRGVGFQPTFRVMAGTRAMFDPATLESASLVKVVPAALLDWYRKPQAQWFKRDLEQEDFDSLAPDRIRTLLERPIGRAERAARYLFDSGHPLLLASDHPANPGHGNHPGLSTHLELLHMAKIGVPPGDLLAAATINNARALGVTDRYGTVEAGKVANLLLLRSNPLEDVSAYDEIEWVIVRGRPIRRETLAADYER